MNPRIIHVRHVGEYRLELGFNNGMVREIDLAPQVLGRGGVFAPFADVDFFRRVRLEPDAGTIVWPNGVDLCPDVLYGLATGQPAGPHPCVSV